jgi:hypothetical protein
MVWPSERWGSTTVPLPLFRTLTRWRWVCQPEQVIPIPQLTPDRARALQMFTIYIAKAAANFGLPATRSIYQRAIEVLPDRQTADMCLRFAALERKLGEIDRARAIYAHASQFCDPRTYTDFWSEWNAFESESPRPAFRSDPDD